MSASDRCHTDLQLAGLKQTRFNLSTEHASSLRLLLPESFHFAFLQDMLLTTPPEPELEWAVLLWCEVVL